jgi:hypothetical protein
MLREAGLMHNFMLFMVKRVTTRVKWTKDEISQLKSHMKHLALCATAVIIFAFPFGLFLLPLFTELIDRRWKRRIST